MTRTRAFFIFAGVVLELAGMQPMRSADDIAESGDEPTVGILPIIPLATETNMLVKVAFENISNRELMYLQGNAPQAVGGLRFAIFKDGRRVNPLGGGGSPAILDESRVRTLRPGESVLQMERLRDYYGELEAGSYELKVQYDLNEGSVPHLEYGMTPLKIDRKVALLQVR